MEQILLVDDEKDIRELLKARFESGDFKCLTAKNGRKFLQAYYSAFYTV